MTEIEKQRTTSQNSALWLFFQQLSDELNNAGHTQRDVFEKAVAFDAPNTKHSIHDIWIYFQKKMYKTDSTTELHKHEQITEIHKVVMKNMGEVLHIDYIPFPSYETDKNLAPFKEDVKIKAPWRQ